MKRRVLCLGLGLAGCATWRLASGQTAAPEPAAAPPVTPAGTPAIAQLGVVSLLGDSVMVYARQNREVSFKDLAMDALVMEIAGQALQARAPQARLLPVPARAGMTVDQQIEIGTAAGRRGTLPPWLQEAAQAGGMSHLLIVGSEVGPMEFRTGLTQVVGNSNVAGVGFWVGADFRWKNAATGVTFNGYLAPFVQLRVSLIEVQSRRVVQSLRLSEGYAAGPSESEAPDPWQFLNRQQKARALTGLLRKNLTRGIETVLAAG